MSAWRAPPGADSDEEDVIFVGPVTDREMEMSRLLDETVCLPDADQSDAADDTLAGLAHGLRAVALEGTRESSTMHELELPSGGAAEQSTRLDDSAAAPLASAETTGSSRQWEEMPSQAPLSSTRLTEESGVWEDMPSENPLPDQTAAEESRMWEEIPSENPLTERTAAEAQESRVSEEMSSVNPLPDPAGVEESRVWEEMPSENPLRAPAAAEESQWEELPSECPLSAPPPAADDTQQWEELPSELPLATPAMESLCEDLSDEPDPTAGSHWLTLASSDGEDGPGDSLDERRETPGALLDALSEELAGAGRPSGGAVPRVSVTEATPVRRVSQPVSPGARSSSGSGLLQVMHRQLSSPGGASVDSYHTCYGGGAAGDDSRRLTAASVLSDVSLTPAAPPNSTAGLEAAGDLSEDDSRLYESSVEELPGPARHAVEESPRLSAGARTMDIASPALAGRDRVASLASESSLAGSYVSVTSTGSEMNDTLEMMEKLLAMEAEERRLESIIQSRAGGGEQTEVLSASESEDGAQAAGGGELEVAGDAPAAEAATPSRPTPSGTAGKKATPVPTPTPRGRGRPAALTPRQPLAAGKTPSRLVTPRGRAGPTPTRAGVSRLRTPTPVTRTVAPQPTTPRTKPNLKDIVSPVARYIHEGPEPVLVQNVRPRTRVVNSVVPQPRPTPHKLAPLAEEAGAGPSGTEEGNVLRELNTSNTSIASAGSSASGGSRIPVKVSRPAGGQENKAPAQSRLPKVSYKSSGNLVMDKTAWNKLVKKNTAENRKVGRFVPNPSPVIAVKHMGHKSVASRRVRWNDEFSVPDMTVRVRPMRRSVSDCDVTQGSDASFMEVSVCEVRNARPVRH